MKSIFLSAILCFAPALSQAQSGKQLSCSDVLGSTFPKNINSPDYHVDSFLRPRSSAALSREQKSMVLKTAKYFASHFSESEPRNVAQALSQLSSGGDRVTITSLVIEAVKYVSVTYTTSDGEVNGLIFPQGTARPAGYIVDSDVSEQGFAKLTLPKNLSQIEFVGPLAIDSKTYNSTQRSQILALARYFADGATGKGSDIKTYAQAVAFISSYGHGSVGVAKSGSSEYGYAMFYPGGNSSGLLFVESTNQIVGYIAHDQITNSSPMRAPGGSVSSDFSDYRELNSPINLMEIKNPSFLQKAQALRLAQRHAEFMNESKITTFAEAKNYFKDYGPVGMNTREGKNGIRYDFVTFDPGSTPFGLIFVYRTSQIVGLIEDDEISRP